MIEDENGDLINKPITWSNQQQSRSAASAGNTTSSGLTSGASVSVTNVVTAAQAGSMTSSTPSQGVCCSMRAAR